MKHREALLQAAHHLSSRISTSALLLLLLLCAPFAVGQNARVVVQTRDGGFLIAGPADNPNGDTLPTRYNLGHLILKLVGGPDISSSQNVNMIGGYCSDTTVDTLFVTNIGSQILHVQSVFFLPVGGTFSATFARPLPDSILPGDSIPVVIHYQSQYAVAQTSTMYIYSDDTVAGHNPWPILITAARDSIKARFARIPTDTLDMGLLACNQSSNDVFLLVSESTIYAGWTVDTSNLRPFTTHGLNGGVDLNPGQDQIVNINVPAGLTPGRYVRWISFTDACGKTITAYIAVIIDSSSLELSSLADTSICVNDTAIHTLFIRNYSRVTQKVVLENSGGRFQSTPDTSVIAPGDSAKLVVIFTGAPSSGDFPFQGIVVDACGGTHSIAFTVHVNGVPIDALSSISDTTICPGTSVFRLAKILNPSNTPQFISLVSNNALFSFVPDTLSLNAGDSAIVNILFAGSPIIGTYTFNCPLPGCGAVQMINALVKVDGPHIDVPVSFSVAVCPGMPISFPVVITNNDSVSQSLTLSGTACTISTPGLVIGAHQSDSVIATFAGAPLGTYSCVIHADDECGINHDVTITVNVQNQPSVQMSLFTDVTPLTIGHTARVAVIAKPLSAVSAAEYTITVEHEPTALALLSVTTPCVATIRRGMNSDTITFSACGSLPSDTIGALNYQTLVGSTLSPWIRLDNVTTTSTCQTVSGLDSAIIALLPAGCELGTVLVHPFTSTIQSISPNPAMGMTAIAYATIEAANVQLDVRDALGRTVATLVNEWRAPGIYTTALDARLFASGMFIVRLLEGGRSVSKALLLLK